MFTSTNFQKKWDNLVPWCNKHLKFLLDVLKVNVCCCTEFWRVLSSLWVGVRKAGQSNNLWSLFVAKLWQIGHWFKDIFSKWQELPSKPPIATLRLSTFFVTHSHLYSVTKTVLNELFLEIRGTHGKSKHQFPTFHESWVVRRYSIKNA
jgi:hypothetical protein